MDAATPSLRPGSLLIVDDDEATRQSLRLILEDEGYAVAEATTPVEALAHLRAAAASHVVLLDWLMAQKADVLLHAVQHIATLRRHAYVVLTAAPLSRFSPDERLLIDSLCIEVITKPFDLLRLLEAVEQAAAQLSGNSAKL